MKIPNPWEEGFNFLHAPKKVGGGINLFKKQVHVNLRKMCLLREKWGPAPCPPPSMLRVCYVLVNVTFKKRKWETLSNRTSKSLKTLWSYLPYWNSSVKQEVDHVISKVWCLHLGYFSIIDKQKGKHVSYHFYIILIHLSETISLYEGLCFQKLQVWEKVVLLYFSYRVTHTWYWTEIKSRTRRLMFLFLILYKFSVLSTKFHFTCLLLLWFCP